MIFIFGCSVPKTFDQELHSPTSSHEREYKHFFGLCCGSCDKIWPALIVDVRNRNSLIESPPSIFIHNLSKFFTLLTA